jgi:type VI secretion system protein VasD
VRVKTFIAAASDINPDATGRPSPLVVRIFEMRNDAEFSGADFFALYEREKETLGSSLVVRQEYVLQPGEKREVWLPVARDARYLGAVAAVRDIRGARWRMLTSAPRKTFGDNFSRDTISITASRGGITLGVKD